MKMSEFLCALSKRNICMGSLNQEIELNEWSLIYSKTEIEFSGMLYVADSSLVESISDEKIRESIFLSPGMPATEGMNRVNHIYICDIDTKEGLAQLVREIFLLYKKYQENRVQLYQFFLEYEDIGLLINYAGDFFGNPLAYFDGGTKPVYVSDEEKMEKALCKNMREASASKLFSLNQEQLVIFHEINKKLRTNKGSFLWEADMEPARILCRIGGENSHLTLVEGEKKFDFTDYLLMDILASIITNYIEKQSERTIGNMRLIFIEACMDGNYTEEELKKHADVIGWEYTETKKLILLETEDVKNLGLYTRFLQLYLDEFNDFCHIIQIKSYIICLLTIPDERVFRVLKKFLEDHSLFGAVSSEFSKYCNFKFAWRQAENLIYLGKEFLPHQRLFFSEDLEEQQKLFLLEQNHLLFSFCLVEWKRLEEYDTKYYTNYTEIFYVYLEMDQNFVKTAERLGIHRNTLSKKITSGEEIMGISLKDPKTVERMRMTFRVKDFLKVHTPADCCE